MKKSRHITSRLNLFIILLALFYITQSFANSSINNQDINVLSLSSIQLSGFGTLAATSAGDDKLGYLPKLTQKYQTGNWDIKSNSLLGIQVDLLLTEQLDANLQLVFKDRSNNGLNKNVEWANLKYTFDNDNYTVRAGRMGADLYMLSEYLNASYAYLWARPIEEFYKPDMFSSFDGIDLAYQHQIADGYLQFKLSAGKTQADLTHKNNYLHMEFSGFMGVNISYEDTKWRFRLAANQTNLKKMTDPIPTMQSSLSSVSSIIWPNIDGIRNEFSVHNKKFSYYSLGFSYDHSLVVQSELAYLQSQLAFFPSSYSGYLSIGKQINQFTPFVVYSKIIMADEAYQLTIPNIPSLTGLQQTLQQIVASHQIDQHSLTLGVRWDIKSKMALKAQWTHTEIIDNKSALWAQLNYPSGESSMDTISLSLDFVF